MIQVSHLVLKNEWRIWEETSLDAFDFPPHLSQRSSQIDWRDKLASMYLYNKLPLNGWVPLSGICLGGASRASGWTVSHEGPPHIRGNNLCAKWPDARGIESISTERIGGEEFCCLIYDSERVRQLRKIGYFLESGPLSPFKPPLWWG